MANLDPGRRKIAAITDLTSEVADNGRRGNPRPGCDCVQCFGYCLIDADEAARQSTLAGGTPRQSAGPLDFDA